MVKNTCQICEHVNGRNLLTCLHPGSIPFHSVDYFLSMSAAAMTDKPYYTSEQIPIPTEFPDILLQFSKAAIRTQPADVLVWSAAYVS